jgi:hypothetical protein
VVAPIENLTRVTGTIKARSSHPSLAGWDVVTLAVSGTEPVDGTADLLTDQIHGEAELAVRHDLLPDEAIGSRVSCRAKLTPAGAMCEAYPSPEDFTVSTS